VELVSVFPVVKRPPVASYPSEKRYSEWGVSRLSSGNTHSTVMRPLTVGSVARSSWNVALRRLYSTNGEEKCGRIACFPLWDRGFERIDSAITRRLHLVAVRLCPVAYLAISSCSTDFRTSIPLAVARSVNDVVSGVECCIVPRRRSASLPATPSSTGIVRRISYTSQHLP